jgi:PGF-CTERM protein
VTFVKAGPFADDIEGTVNARAIDGEPVATGTPDGTVVSLTHVAMPDQKMNQVELRYEIPESRLSELGTSADEITAHRFDGSSWQNVDVEVTEETESGTVLTAELSNTTTSYFALTAPTVEDEPAGGDDMTESDDGTSSDDSIPGFGMVAALLAIIAAAALVRRQ